MDIFKATFFFIALNFYSQNSPVKVTYVVNQDNSVDFSYVKSAPGSYAITFKFDRLENTSADRTTFVLKDHSGSLFTLRPKNKDGRINFSYSTTIRRGVLNPKTDPNFVYLIPFARGKKVQVFEHTNAHSVFFGAEVPKNWKAYQFVPESADTVYAARKGVVISLEDQFELDTVSYFTSQRNTIKVEHPDGTYSEYKGFKKDGILVVMGQTIYPMMPLGLIMEKSGSLSFMVYLNIKVDHNPHENLQSYKSRIECITPLFYTGEGITKLNEKATYTANYDDKTVLQELSKKEIKNLNKKL